MVFKPFCGSFGFFRLLLDHILVSRLFDWAEMHWIHALLRNVHISCHVFSSICRLHASKWALRLRVQVSNLFRTELTTSDSKFSICVASLSLSSSSCHSSLLSFLTQVANGYTACLSHGSLWIQLDNGVNHRGILHNLSVSPVVLRLSLFDLGTTGEVIACSTLPCFRAWWHGRVTKLVLDGQIGTVFFHWLAKVWNLTIRVREGGTIVDHTLWSLSRYFFLLLVL